MGEGGGEGCRGGKVGEEGGEGPAAGFARARHGEVVSKFVLVIGAWGLCVFIVRDYACLSVCVI